MRNLCEMQCVPSGKLAFDCSEKVQICRWILALTSYAYVCRGLTELQLAGGCLSEAFFYALAMECAVLQKLEIHDSVLGSGGAQEIQLRHDSLLYLVVKKCRVLRIAIR